jgi:hypothetical protein
MGTREGVYRDLVGKPEERRPFGKPVVDETKILKRIFRKLNGAWIGFIWLRMGTGGELL